MPSTTYTAYTSNLYNAPVTASGDIGQALADQTANIVTTQNGIPHNYLSYLNTLFKQTPFALWNWYDQEITSDGVVKFTNRSSIYDPTTQKEVGYVIGSFIGCFLPPSNPITNSSNTIVGSVSTSIQIRGITNTNIGNDVLDFWTNAPQTLVITVASTSGSAAQVINSSNITSFTQNLPNQNTVYTSPMGIIRKDSKGKVRTSILVGNAYLNGPNVFSGNNYIEKLINLDKATEIETYVYEYNTSN